MSSLNSVNLIGRLGSDPDGKMLPSGEAVSNFSIATSEQWTDKRSGDKKEQTEWHRIAMFGRVAEIANQYLQKGDMVYIGGKLRTRKWTDKQGVERYSTEIVGRDLKMLVTKGRKEQAPTTQAQEQQAASPPPPADFDDDIPF